MLGRIIWVLGQTSARASEDSRKSYGIRRTVFGMEANGARANNIKARANHKGLRPPSFS